MSSANRAEITKIVRTSRSIIGRTLPTRANCQCSYLSATYRGGVSIFRFLDTRIDPVQKKGLTRFPMDDNVHFGNGKCRFSFGSFAFTSIGTGGRSGTNQASTWDSLVSRKSISRETVLMLRLRGKFFKHSDLKKADSASEIEASVPGRLRLNRWGPAPDCDWRTSIPRRRPHRVELITTRAAT